MHLCTPHTDPTTREAQKQTNWLTSSFEDFNLQQLQPKRAPNHVINMANANLNTFLLKVKQTIQLTKTSNSKIYQKNNNKTMGGIHKSNIVVWNEKKKIRAHKKAANANHHCVHL